PRFFTPVNEPSITALTAGLWGLWNDRRSSPADHAVALAHAVLADLEAFARISADRDAWWIGAEGFGCQLAATPDAEPAAARARALEQLPWDLRFGVDPDPVAARRLEAVDDRILDRIAAHTLGHDRVVAGHDMYPVSVRRHGDGEGDGDDGGDGEGDDGASLTLEERLAAYDDEARRWHARYQRDFWVSETSNLGLPVEDGPRWLKGLVGVLDGLLADGLPVRGICWYSRGDQYDWHTMLARPVGEVTEVGLFDADRRPRPVAEAYAHLAHTRATAV
ncbi:MAG TPA: hypothetical protein VIL36_22300, partial [Acidimicrobiales bacterium]